jgi:release factor glutamine methyltransferase
LLSIHSALQDGVRLLDEAGVAVPRLTAEVLLCFALGKERSYLYAHPEEPLSENAWIHYGRYLHERIKGKPTQYITKRQEFYGREFRVTQDVLIPRPETEHLVEAALARIGRGARVLDVGAGSGAIAITLALETAARVAASDISGAALGVAKGNSRKLGARVDWLLCDLASAVADRSLDVLVSNPPYVPSADTRGLQREVRDWEPHLALFGGPTGLEIYVRLIEDARRAVRPGGWVLMELGYNSVVPVQEMLRDGWTDIEVRTDLAGLPRVIEARHASVRG